MSDDIMTVMVFHGYDSYEGKNNERIFIRENGERRERKWRK